MNRPLILVFLPLVYLSGMGSGVEVKDHTLHHADTLQNLGTVLSNRFALESRLHCYLDIKPCPKEAEKTKKLLPEIFKTSCAHCTKDQSVQIKMFFNKVKEILPQDYKTILEKYAHGGKYQENFDKWLDLKEI